MNEHKWDSFLPNSYRFCSVCGVVERADGENPPCKGPTKMRPFEERLDSVSKSYEELEIECHFLSHELEKLRRAVRWADKYQGDSRTIKEFCYYVLRRWDEKEHGLANALLRVLEHKHGK